MVMSLVHDDLVKRPGVLAIASYVDDTVIISDRRPELDESPLEFLASLKVVSDTDHKQLASPIAEGLAALRLNEEKCGTSFVRYVPKREVAEDDVTSIPELAQAQWDAYLEDDSWPPTPGGREPRETVLRAPLTRERVPRKLKEEILSLLEEVRIGMSGVEARVAFDQLISEIDKAQFIRLRPFWTEITVIAIAAHGVDAVRTLTAFVRDLCETVIAPPGSTASARKALSFGLRESWRQSLAQALAVATTSSQRSTLLKRFPRMDLGGPRPYSMKSTIDRAMRIRRRRLVPPDHVAVALAEFSDWKGKLIGPGAFASFLDWTREEHPEGQADELAAAVFRAVRFVRLHEACLAIHLWGGNEAANWIEETFEVLGSQPLIQQELVRELREKAVASLGTSGRGLTRSPNQDRDARCWGDRRGPTRGRALQRLSAPMDDRQSLTAHRQRDRLDGRKKEGEPRGFAGVVGNGSSSWER